MAKFHTKPVVIRAFRMTTDHRTDHSEWPNWLNDAWLKKLDEEGGMSMAHFKDGTDQFVIFTLQGVMLVDWGDWIIQGVKGELYACKPDIFEMTYEACQ